MNEVPAKIETAEPAIRLQNLCRWFGKTRAVDRVSFDVYPGEVFGFIGPNGAGKTTSMRILATLDMPTEGEAWIDGFSVIDDADRVRRRLGFMPDGFGTYSDVNCEEYLDFFARAYGLRGDARLDALRNVMRFTQLDQLAQKSVSGLSKGMKQRLCLGRALIHDPSVLILDEPAAGLDPRARIELRDMIRNLAGQGKSILVSSHILTELAEICDRVAIIEQGHLLAVGTVDEILSRKSRLPDAHSVDSAALHEDRIQLSIEVISDFQQAADWLRAQPDVQQMITNGRLIQLDFPDDPHRQAELLAEMIRSGIRVASFAGKRRSLEDAFLHVTRGRIQ